jgi:predicted site-specific integrase-resolvase
VTHRDRLARFGTKWIESTLDSAQVRLEVLHPEDPEADLMSDFMSLIASFAGRLYGQRSVQARQRLLSQAQEQL